MITSRLKPLLTVSVLILTLILVVTSNSLAQVGNNQGLLDANTASEKQLSDVPHLKGDLAGSIVKQRPFASVTELDKLLGKSLNAEQRKTVFGKVFVHINLNKASREELLLIPGVGRRMAHEFEEYRPYKALIQFRREIGKYVDKKEVARLEQYIFIPVNLNTAKDDAILSIPGVGKRLLHEFKEYRPYKSMAQFRREIGKYVDKPTVGRLERYVTIK